MICVVVIDAWKHCEDEDLKLFPWIEKETKLFGSFLDLQLSNIKQKYHYDIIHCASGLDIMDEIQTKDLIVNNISELPVYDFYYFCGFHLGRCIYNNVKRSQKTNYGVILNLSMVYPEDSYEHYVNKHKQKNYLYSYSKGFECITITT